MHLLPRNPTAHEVHRWVAAERQDGVPPGVLHRYLQSLDTSAYDLEGLKAFLSETGALFSPMVDRNIKGMELEKTGDLDGAIRLYEANIKDGFDGSHPYDRLRILYKKRKDLPSAKAVCETFLEVSSQLKNPDNKLCDVFRREIAKLESMNAQTREQI